MTTTGCVRLVAITCAAVALSVPARTQAQARRMTLDDVRTLVRLSDPQISPDGRTVLVTVSRADYEANAFRSELVAVDVASSAHTVLVRGQPGLGHVRWSPSGRQIAFLAGTGASRQVHVIPAAGGEPTQLTRSATAVQFFAWRPGAEGSIGGGLAFVAADPRPERSGAARHDDVFEVANDHYMTTAPPMPSHVWLVTTAGQQPRRLTSGTWSLSTSLGSSPLSWSPDGRSIAFVRLASGSPGDTNQGVVTVLDVESGTTRDVTGRRMREATPLFSPDGARIAYTYPRDGDPANVDEVFVAPASGGAGESVTRALDRQVSMEDWWPDGSSLLLSGTDGTRGALWLQPLRGAARKLNLGDVVSVAGASASRAGVIALVGSEPARPPELYVLTPDAAPRRLTSFNARIAGLALGRSERVTWTGPDGRTSDGVVTYPPEFDARRRHPLVLVIHGGPTASSTEGFSSLVQLLAARGWVVFQPNYRGSDNLGNAYQRAIANDAAEGPGRDVMAGVDALAARGFVDTARVAVSGWSYGGFMTAWLIGRYPGRWRAAVAGAAPVDITDMYALTDLNVMRRHAITESPFVGDRLRAYLEMSPLIHLPKARTPTLVMSTTGDVRVVVTGSYKIYRALKDNGVPVQFVAFPGGGHSPADPVRQLERDRRWVEWLARWLGEGA
ncbi:MAG: prolyl oligopeptidase family serine peptidase [Gemmatimonadaceae bacterium]